MATRESFTTLVVCTELTLDGVSLRIPVEPQHRLVVATIDAVVGAVCRHCNGSGDTHGELPRGPHQLEVQLGKTWEREPSIAAASSWAKKHSMIASGFICRKIYVVACSKCGFTLKTAWLNCKYSLI